MLRKRYYIIGAIFALFVWSAPARGGDVYSVSNIEVDATASTAVRARQVAILDGHAAALNRLLRRLTLPEDWVRLPRLSGKDARLLSIGYSMTQERNSATRYFGRISVRFVPQRIQALLGEQDIPFGDVQIRSALVIPVYDLPNGRRLVWDSQNIWRTAWGRPDISESLTPFTLPVGNIEDILALPAKAARINNRGGLFQLAKRYNANRILFAHAKLEKVNWKGGVGYAISVKLHLLKDRANPDSDEVMHFALSGDKDPKALVVRSVDDILRMTGIAWKQRIIVHHGEASEHEVAINFKSLLEWQKVRKLLDDVSVLKGYQVLRIGNNSALLKLNFTGSPDILSVALKQNKIELIIPEDEEEVWQLKLKK